MRADYVIAMESEIPKDPEGMMQWLMNQAKKTLGVSAAQVHMAKMRISRLIKSEVRTLEKKMI